MFPLPPVQVDTALPAHRAPSYFLLCPTFHVVSPHQCTQLVHAFSSLPSFIQTVSQYFRHNAIAFPLKDGIWSWTSAFSVSSMEVVLHNSSVGFGVSQSSLCACGQVTLTFLSLSFLICMFIKDHDYTYILARRPIHKYRSPGKGELTTQS